MVFDCVGVFFLVVLLEGFKDPGPLCVLSFRKGKGFFGRLVSVAWLLAPWSSAVCFSSQ